MSVRLNVLLAQSPRASALQSKINAELAVQLMGISGLDLSIVSSLDSGIATETDRLLLESFQNDLAVLDWSGLEVMFTTLRRCGVSGYRAPHRLDPSPPPPSDGGRRLYLVDLRRGDKPSDIVTALKQLLDDRRVVAVPINSLVLSKSKAPPAKSSSRSSVSLPPASETRESIPPEPNNSPSDLELEALVDEVNGADW